MLVAGKARSAFARAFPSQPTVTVVVPLSQRELGTWVSGGRTPSTQTRDVLRTRIQHQEDLSSFLPANLAGSSEGEVPFRNFQALVKSFASRKLQMANDQETERMGPFLGIFSWKCHWPTVCSQLCSALQEAANRRAGSTESYRINKGRSASSTPNLSGKTEQ